MTDITYLADRKDSYIVYSPDRRGDFRLVIKSRYIGRYHSFEVAFKVADSWLSA